MLDLADRFRCITVDLRGHGDSDKPWGDYTYDLFCRDFAALMKELALSDVTLVGWSMGAGIALKYVQTIGEPVKRLVTTGSVAPRFAQAPDAPFGTPPEEVQGLIDAVRFARTETIVGVYENNFHRTDFQATRDWFIQIGWKVPAFVGVTASRRSLMRTSGTALRRSRSRSPSFTADTTRSVIRAGRSKWRSG